MKNKNGKFFNKLKINSIFLFIYFLSRGKNSLKMNISERIKILND